MHNFGNLRGNMEIKITVNVGPDTFYTATFHPAPESRNDEGDGERASTVESGTSQVAPGLAISFPPAPVSLPV
jgi:hypothetical protein